MSIEEKWRPIFEAMEVDELLEIHSLAGSVIGEQHARHGGLVSHVPGSGYVPRKGPPTWFFRVTGVDSTKKGMPAFDGEFLRTIGDPPHPTNKKRQALLMPGDIIIACTNDGVGEKRYGIGLYSEGLEQGLGTSGATVAGARICGVSIGRRFTGSFSDIIKWAEEMGVPAIEKEAPA